MLNLWFNKDTGAYPNLNFYLNNTPDNRTINAIGVSPKLTINLTLDEQTNKQNNNYIDIKAKTTLVNNVPTGSYTVNYNNQSIKINQL